ncbi:MAG: hypothetical protein IPP33_00180 [Flavobacteriales bacterium]|nr:hypothetical protein [Flavobacteriales bacterium]
MFRTVFPTMAIALVASASFAQRPTATFVGGSLVRLDLDGFRVFADAPMDHKGIGPDDIALYATEPPTPVLGGRAFTPAFSGEVLDRRTERLGEKTGIYVNPRSTPLAETPHYSYLVQWNGRRVYFTGDTEDIKDLLETHDLDVAFVTPTIMAAFEKAGRVIEARTVVIHHTTNKGTTRASLSVPCDRCKVVLPTPGGDPIVPLADDHHVSGSVENTCVAEVLSGRDVRRFRPHSCRNAFTGSNCAARIALKLTVTTAIASTTKDASANTSGSMVV